VEKVRGMQKGRHSHYSGHHSRSSKGWGQESFCGVLGPGRQRVVSGETKGGKNSKNNENLDVSGVQRMGPCQE